ncbi:hypothetical protein KVR01_000638 [Diaporthe batatas]|uniref:uncharacterized protein n=1 Tax=Diaporthe batatas TaxID=748121 RepID=UPI001D052C25|nr:uncharacterized protein KVR01_000638 [Diaporthe batatas]KAG8169893.1 hypothetical protein KVR01_000638 [Diaporthe batatas]
MSFGFGGGGFGQNNQTSNTFGGGGFGANTNNTTSAFGSSSTPAFGAPAQTTNTGGGLFGGGGTTGGFGSNTGGAFGSGNTGFGAAKPAFGAATTGTGGGLFGSTTTTSGGTGFGSGFGTNTAATSSPFGGGATNSLFGANKTSTPFGGGTTATSTGSTLFGSGSAFGGSSNTTGAFGGATNNPGIGTNVGDPPGTAVLAFSPYLEKEPNSTAQNAFQNILFQEPYKKFSAEELRMADYAQGRQYGNGPAGGGGAFGATSGFGSGGFGTNTAQTTGFGSTNTGTGLFGNTQNNTGATGFGSTSNTTGFGAGATGGGLFGQNKPATGGGLFGSTTATSQPAPAGGLFGSTGGTTGGFGATNTATTGFGSNTGGGLFGNTQNKPATTTGFTSGFGSGTTGTGFGANTGTSTGFGQNTATNTGGGLFGNTNTQQANTGGGLFGGNAQQQPQSTGFGTGGFGQTNTQQPGGGLFGNQNKPAATTGGGLFGNTGAQQNTGGLFGGANTNTNTNAFGQNNTQQQGGGGLFGVANKPATGGGLFGGATTGQTGQTGGGLFGGLGSNNQTQQQQTGTTSLFGNLGGNQNQNKTSLFGGQTGQSTGGGLFGNQNTQQVGGGLFGQSTAQQPQQNALGNSLFGASQNSQPGPQALTASIGDVNAYGTPSLFSGLGNGEVQNPGPLATPLSGKKKERKGSILPMWKLNPGSSTRFNTPVKRGFGFSYSTYGSPATPSSAGSTPGGLGQSLLGTGSLNRSLSKSVSSSNLRKSFNAEDSILTPGSFSSSMGTRPYGSAGLKKLNIDKSLRLDLFSSPSRDKQLAESPGPRKLPKRVSFDTSLDASENGTLDGTPTPSTSAQDLGFIRPTNGGSLTTNGSKSPDAQPEMEQVKGNELAVVHEESSTTSTTQDATSSPSKEAGAYWLSPSKDEILKMNRVQRGQVPGFTVGRYNVGQVQFKTPVDLTNIDLDEIPGGIVVLETRSCTVYPVAAKKPPVGKGLNVPSEISLEHSWPRGRDKRTPIPEKSGRAFNKHVERLKKIPDTKFIDYNAETGVWTFEVEHFTTYGLDYDEDDTEGDTTIAEAAPEEATLPAPPMSSFQVEHEHPEPEDTFEFRRKRRALPGAFDYTGAISDDEEEMADANEQSFLSNRSVGSTSKAFEHHEAELMDEEHALPEAQDTSAYLGYHQAAEPDYDSPYQGSMVEYQETPGGIMRARMRAIKDSNAPLRLQVADGDDWMDMLQKTIGPAKRDRAALKAMNEEETYEDLKASVRQDAPQAKPRAVPDGRGFATSIELMNSLFEKPRAPARAAPAPIPTSGFKWPYKRQDKTGEEDEANMDPADKAFHDTLRPSWGPDGTLVISSTPKTLTRSSRRALEKDGIMAMGRLNIVSEHRDIRFAKFSNETSPKSLANQMNLTRVKLIDNVPTVSLGPVNALTAFFHGQDLQKPANVHEKMVWELASILFDPVSDPDGKRVPPSGLRQARRRNLSEFWQNTVEEASNRAVGMARSPEDKAIASLSGHRVPDACKHLLDGKNFRLATLVSLIGTSDQLMQDMREQVKGWREANVLSEFTEPIRAIYELLGGNVCAVEGSKGTMENRMESFILSQRFGLDWKQAFGLRLWYAITSADDVVEAIHSFAEDIQQDKEPRPQPWYAEQGIAALWDDPDKDLREDLMWGLLKLYADKEIDLADILRPENSQLSPLDNRLCWQLGQALVNTGKVSFGRDAEDKADAATLTFAWQLTNDGHWLEAVFVLLYLTRPEARAKAIQEHLSHHAKLIGGEQSEDFTTLTQTFKIPAEWVWQAKALYMRSVKGNPRQEVVYLLRAGSYAEAHKTFTKQVAPAAVIERDWDGLDDLLAEFGDDAGRFVPDWNFGGKIYCDFVELIRHVEHGSAATVPPKVVEGLMAGLPALHESVQVRQDADVLEVAAVADMASEVAKVVVELAKKGETTLTQVLGLPLTEDAYLKYSNELAFAYYKDVMVGRS